MPDSVLLITLKDKAHLTSSFLFSRRKTVNREFTSISSGETENYNHKGIYTGETMASIEFYVLQNSVMVRECKSNTIAIAPFCRQHNWGSEKVVSHLASHSQRDLNTQCSDFLAFSSCLLRHKSIIQWVAFFVLFLLLFCLMWELNYYFCFPCWKPVHHPWTRMVTVPQGKPKCLQARELSRQGRNKGWLCPVTARAG